MNKPFVIAISAVSGGGKTTAVKLLNKLLPSSIALFFDDYELQGPDDYKKWVSCGADYNAWKLKPLVDDLTARMQDKDPSTFILLDYPFAYLNNEMKSYIDLTVFIDTPLDVALARRILRDHNDAPTERIRQDLLAYLSGAREAYAAMLQSVKPNSDVVVNGNQQAEAIVEQLLKTISERASGSRAG